MLSPLTVNKPKTTFTLVTPSLFLQHTTAEFSFLHSGFVKFIFRLYQ